MLVWIFEDVYGRGFRLTITDQCEQRCLYAVRGNCMLRISRNTAMTLHDTACIIDVRGVQRGTLAAAAAAAADIYSGGDAVQFHRPAIISSYISARQVPPTVPPHNGEAFCRAVWIRAWLIPSHASPLSPRPCIACCSLLHAAAVLLLPRCSQLRQTVRSPHSIRNNRLRDTVCAEVGL